MDASMRRLALLTSFVAIVALSGCAGFANRPISCEASIEDRLPTTFHPPATRDASGAEHC
jgi:hypothetical protein